jgi:TPR repeat protein
MDDRRPLWCRPTIPPRATAGSAGGRVRAISAIAIGLCVFAAVARAGPYEDAQTALAKGDTATALRLFQSAAGQGNTAAAYNLGRIFSLGTGVPADPKMAVIWFRRAANEGNPGAQYNLGLAYQEGLGVRRDIGEAAKWYRKAADQDYADAQARLGALYAKGQGVGQDFDEAAKWYRSAASHGDARATLDLAIIQAEGPRPAAVGSATSQAEFNARMNEVFGAGRWRETGGYRTQARENQLRAEGALTVKPGGVSRHSMGTPDAPGAYDIVVAGMSPGQAAVKIEKSGVAFHRLFPEGEHGTQGAHLHVEPFLTQLREAIWRKNVPGQPKPVETAAKAGEPDATPARDKAEALSLLKSAAARGDSCAQRALGKNSVDGEASARAYLTLQKSGSCG